MIRNNYLFLILSAVKLGFFIAALSDSVLNDSNYYFFKASFNEEFKKLLFVRIDRDHFTINQIRNKYNAFQSYTYYISDSIFSLLKLFNFIFILAMIIILCLSALLNEWLKLFLHSITNNSLYYYYSQVLPVVFFITFGLIVLFPLYYLLVPHLKLRMFINEIKDPFLEDLYQIVDTNIAHLHNPNTEIVTSELDSELLLLQEIQTFITGIENTTSWSLPTKRLLSFFIPPLINAIFFLYNFL